MQRAEDHAQRHGADARHEAESQSGHRGSLLDLLQLCRRIFQGKLAPAHPVDHGYDGSDLPHVDRGWRHGDHSGKSVDAICAAIRDRCSEAKGNAVP